MDDKQVKKLLDELADIKKLLILSASKTGSTSGEIAKVLGAGDSSIRKILTGNDGKKKKS
jgi:predicted transcriptional regulator